MTLYVPHRYRFKWSAVADLTVVPTSCVDPLGPHLHDRREIAAQKTRRPRPPQPVPTDPAERSIERVAERKKGTTRANRPRPPATSAVIAAARNTLHVRRHNERHR